MKKIFLGLLTVLALMAFSNFAVANVIDTNTYTQTQSEDHNTSGKCSAGKCAAGKCGGK